MTLLSSAAITLLLVVVVALPNRESLRLWLTQPRADLREPPADRQATSLLALLPFSFVENRGQWDPRTIFKAQTLGLTAWLEPNATTLQLTHQQGEEPLRGAVVRLTFEGSSPAPVLKGESRQPGRHHYFLGNDPARWQTELFGYRSVLYQGVYQGIDLRVREKAGRLEYDWLLQPEANLAQIAIRTDGVTHLVLSPDGALLLHTGLGPLEYKPPTAWYELPAGRRQMVQAVWTIGNKARYGFRVPDRDPHLPLVIESGLEVAGFLQEAGGDRPVMLATDMRGTATIAGRTRSATRPPSAGSLAAAFHRNTSDVFIIRVNLMDSRLLYATHLGGGGEELINSMIVDTSGAADVGGWTSSLDFPTLPAALRPGRTAPSNFFVAWLDPTGHPSIYAKPAAPPPPAAEEAPPETEEASRPAEAPAATTPVAAHPQPISLTVTAYGSPSPTGCSPMRLDVSGPSLRIAGIPPDAGALLVVARSSANKHVLGSTVLIDRSDVLLTLPALPADPAVGRSELPLSLLQSVFQPGRTVYLQAFTSGCSLMAPFRASNALALAPSPES